MLWSLGAFFALLAVLAVQVRAGGDPALGPGEPVARVEPRRVIVHRVVLRRVVVTERAAPAAPVASDGGVTPAASAPAPSASAPAPSASAPAAPASSAPAPAAPAPAPVTTGAS